MFLIILSLEIIEIGSKLAGRACLITNRASTRAALHLPMRFLGDAIIDFPGGARTNDIHPDRGCKRRCFRLMIYSIELDYTVRAEKITCSAKPIFASSDSAVPARSSIAKVYNARGVVVFLRKLRARVRVLVLAATCHI